MNVTANILRDADSGVSHRHSDLAARWSDFADHTFTSFQPNESKWVKRRDEVVYFFGVVTVVLLSFFTGGHQWLMPIIYTVKFPLLYLTRIIIFFHRHWGYFLLDYCYFANFALLWYVWHGKSENLFISLYCIARGPLAVSTMIFRNALVFHSLDYITSCYIHILPILVTFCLRWYTGGSKDFFIDYDIRRERLGPEDLTWTFVVPMITYLAWGAFFLSWSSLVCPVPEDPSYLTIFRYLVKSKRGALHFLTKVGGGGLEGPLYCLLNVVFAALSLLPAILHYNYQWLDFVWLAVVASAAIWNGGTYVIQVFSRKYAEALARIDERHSQGR